MMLVGLLAFYMFLWAIVAQPVEHNTAGQDASVSNLPTPNSLFLPIPEQPRVDVRCMLNGSMLRDPTYDKHHNEMRGNHMEGSLYQTAESAFLSSEQCLRVSSRSYRIEPKSVQLTRQQYVGAIRGIWSNTTNLDSLTYSNSSKGLVAQIVQAR